MIGRRPRPAGATLASTRMEGYTDAVFAIAATLLVLDLSTASFGTVSSDADLWAALHHLWPSFLSFGVSFLLLSLLWMLHVEQFSHISRVDSGLLWLNNIRLLFIVLIPFTTSLVADYSAFLAGRILLPANFFLAALLGYLSWVWAAARGGHLLVGETLDTLRQEGLGGLAATIIGAGTVALSPWFGSSAFFLYVLNTPLTMLLQRMRRGR